jgi:hypothetical protein
MRSTSTAARTPVSLGEKVIGEADRMRTHYRHMSQAVPAASEISLASHNCEPKYWVNARAAGEGALPTG